MSNFNSYAQEFNTIAKDYLNELGAATSDLANAEVMFNRHKRPAGLWSNPTVEEIANAANAEIGLATAKERISVARTTKLSAAKSKITELRRRLEKELAAHYYADPARVDSNTLALLDSGMLTAAEYASLYEKAIANDNITMARMIGAAAGKYADKLMNIEAPNENQRAERAILTQVSQNAKKCGANEYLNSFDVLVDMFNICSRNPAMVENWDEYAGERVKNF